MMINSSAKRSESSYKKVRFQSDPRVILDQKGCAIQNEVDKSMELIIKGCNTICLDEVSLCRSVTLLDVVTQCGMKKHKVVSNSGKDPDNGDDDEDDDGRPPNQVKKLNDDEICIRQNVVRLEFQNRGSLHLHALFTTSM